MIILGIDPGIATIGFGIVEAHRSQCRVIQYGVLSTPGGVAFVPSADYDL